MKLRTLEIAFGAPDEFAREYADNIANGGIFVETSESFEIRDKVRVQLSLQYARKRIKLDGEVVHIVSDAVAAAGSKPGVAVHFERPAADLRELFEPLLANTPVPTPPVADDRRATPRSRARVSARVVSRGWDEISGRTRDLSIGGVLVSVSTGVPPIDVGEPAEVFISNPETGREQLVLGMVVRHVKGDAGIVRALGVKFCIPEEDRAEVERFLADLAALEHSRHLGGIQGAIEEGGLAGLLRTFGTSSKEGTLDVMRGAEEGYVAFQNGALRAASLGGAIGVKALSRLLGWTEGSFEFHARIDPTLPASESIPLEDAIVEATRLRAESEGADRRVFPLEAILHVDEVKRAASGPLSKLEDAVLDLASAGMNVQSVLDIVPETDAEIYQALQELVDQELLEVWGV